MKNILREILSDKAKSKLRMIVNPSFKNNFLERKRIIGLGKNISGQTTLLGKQFHFVDGLSYLYMHYEIFEKQSYQFVSGKTQPIILDCGSNVGMTIVYMKHIYPNAKIFAYEPDPQLFSILSTNINNFNLENINLIPKAVWHENRNLNFVSDGNEGGKVTEGKDGITVEGVSLSEQLSVFEEIDMLKIDIEGAEVSVFENIRNQLNKVENIFMEYHSPTGGSQKLDRLLKILSENNFRYYIENITPRTKPFLNKSSKIESFDMQINICAYKY